MSTRKVVEEFLKGAGFHVLEAAMENIFVSDADGNIVYFNPSAEAALGWRLDELAGRNIDVLYRDKDVSRGAMTHITSTGRASAYEAVILDKLGREHIYSIKKAPLTDAGGGLIGFMAVSRDVTEARLNEEELRALKEFNEAVLNSARDMITVTDTEGMVTYFNPAAERITGYKKEEVLGQNLTLFYRDDDLALGKLEEIAARDEADEYEAVIVDKQGAEHIFSISKAPLYDDDGRLIGFTATSRDITERRRRIEELRQLKEFNEAVLNSVHDLVVVTDTDGYITYFNPKAEDTTGYRLEEVLGRHISEMYQDPGLSDDKLDYIRETGEANSYEAAIRTKNGEVRILEVNKAPLHDTGGRQFGFAAISRDVTRRKQAEDRVCELEGLLSDRGPVRVESELIHTRAADMIAPDYPFCRPDDTVAQAARALVRLDLPGLPVVGPVGEAVGLVTMKDLVERGLLQGLDRGTPVGEVMHADVVTVPPDTYYFDALAAMVKGRAPLLLVTEGRHLRGILSTDDLMRSRGVTVISLLDGIEEQTGIDQLAAFRTEVDRILMSLVTEGALASQVTGIITEFNDRITRRVIELCLEKAGPAPAEFAWLGLGSEGRKEQTLTTDQDNAIVFDDAAADDREALDYFARLADEIVGGLAACGFALCQGGIMANQPKWSGSLGDWLGRVQTWADSPSPERTRDAMTFLDFRPVYGSRNLAENLRRRANTIVSAGKRLLSPMAEDTLSKGPPIGLFRRYLLKKSGPDKGTLNIKTQGTLVLIDCLRLLAVQEGLFETNTLERLGGLVDREVISESRAVSVTEAYQTLMGLRLQSHIRAIRDGAPPSNHIDPDTLPQWHQQRLKDAFVVAEELQKKVRKIFWWVK